MSTTAPGFKFSFPWESDLDLPLIAKVDKSEGHQDTASDEQYTQTKSGSNITEYRHDSGRRYHAFEENAYFLPNDATEAGRLDLQHYMWKLTFNGFSGRVPITPQMKNVLDVGTGTGIWALEVAQAFPHVQVLGIDLSAIQPESRPPNCRFVAANAEHDWSFETKFDYIHARVITMGMHDWARFFQQSWDFLEPGGWLEVNETWFPQRRADEEDDGSSSQGPFLRWSNLCYDAALKAGIDTRASRNFVSSLETQGYQNVERLDLQWPIGAWPEGRTYKKMGKLCYENMVKAIPAIGSLLLQTQLGMTKSEVDELCGEAVKDAAHGHYYVRMVCHRAQKPAA